MLTMKTAREHVRKTVDCTTEAEWHRVAGRHAVSLERVFDFRDGQAIEYRRPAGLALQTVKVLSSPVDASTGAIVSTPAPVTNGARSLSSLVGSSPLPAAAGAAAKPWTTPFAMLSAKGQLSALPDAEVSAYRLQHHRVVNDYLAGKSFHAHTPAELEELALLSPSTFDLLRQAAGL